MGAFVRTCTDNIARLEASVAAEPALNAHVVAHRHGAVRGAHATNSVNATLTVGAKDLPCQSALKAHVVAHRHGAVRAPSRNEMC